MPVGREAFAIWFCFGGATNRTKKRTAVLPQSILDSAANKTRYRQFDSDHHAVMDSGSGGTKWRAQ
jgi:hypothetical protein